MADSLQLLTAEEEAKYDRLAVRMAYFHNYFKQEFDEIYELADGKFHGRGMNLTMFLQKSTELQRHLTMHHNIEEEHVFPILATKMPSFREDEQHKTAHKLIHDGLDALGGYVQRIRAEPSMYSSVDLRAVLDGFREPLMRHLDEEVNDLRGENMKKYWTLEELNQIPN